MNLFSIARKVRHDSLHIIRWVMNAAAVVAVAVAVVAVETMRKLKFSTYYVMVISLKPD